MREALRKEILLLLIEKSCSPSYEMQNLISGAEMATDYLMHGTIPPIAIPQTPTPNQILGGPSTSQQATNTKANPVVRDYYKRP